jgi:hypothetical protein
MTKIPTPIVDKNGKQTTVHRNPPKLPDPAKLPSRPPRVQEDTFLSDTLDNLEIPVTKMRGMGLEITKNPSELTSQGRTGFVVRMPGHRALEEGVMFEISEISEYDDEAVQIYLRSNRIDELPEGSFVYKAFINVTDIGYEIDEPGAEFFKRVSNDINAASRSFASEMYANPDKEFTDAMTALNSDPSFADFIIDSLSSYTYGVTVESQGKMWHVMTADEMKQNIYTVLSDKQTHRFSSEALSKVTDLPASVFDNLKRLKDPSRRDAIHALATNNITASEFVERIYPEDSDKPVWIDEGNEQREYTTADGTTIYIRRSSDESYS